MIEQVLPAGAVSYETEHDLLDVELFPAEEDAVRGAVAKRRTEFVTGRGCARRALAQLGVEPCPVPSGPGREPIWPAGIVGSITHCDGLRACAVARTRDVRSFGIDAELRAPLPPGVLQLIANAAERAALRELPAELCADRVLFSVKEAIYKAWYPVAARWLGFEEVEVSLSADARSFHARLLVDEPGLTGFTGRWAVAPGLIAAGAVAALEGG
jgi:4'-phosphopantetheinyl transferase EntD